MHDRTFRQVVPLFEGNPQFPILRLHVDSVVTAVNAASPAVTRKSKYRNNDTGTAALFLVRLSQHSTFVPVPHQRTDSYWRFTGASSRKTPIGGNSGDSQLVRILHCHGAVAQDSRCFHDCFHALARIELPISAISPQSLYLRRSFVLVSVALDPRLRTCRSQE